MKLRSNLDFFLGYIFECYAEMQFGSRKYLLENPHPNLVRQSLMKMDWRKQAYCHKRLYKIYKTVLL